MNTDTSPPEPASEFHIQPLATGTLLLERYAIRGLERQEPERNVYRVGETRLCPVCGVENDGDTDICGFCSAPLPAAPALVLIEQRIPRALHALPPTSFILGEYLYRLAHAGDSTPLPFKGISLTHGLLTDVGLRRGARGDPNEDALVAFSFAAEANAEHAAFGLYAVADGIGGAAAGEVASQMALETVVQETHTRILRPLLQGTAMQLDLIRRELAESVRMANQKLMAYARARHLEMGTTLALALVLDGHVLIVNVGDSRVYLYRAGKLEALTRDHSYVARLIEKGELKPDEIYTHPQRNVILKSLGDPSGDEFDLLPPLATVGEIALPPEEGAELREEGGAWELEPGDQLVLCTDGLWEMVRPPEIANILQNAADPQEACAKLVGRANGAGGVDNISVVIVHL